MKRLQWLTAPLGKEAQGIGRWIYAGMLVLIITTGVSLTYGLTKTAELTASQIGQLEVNLLAEGEAERLDLSLQEDVREASPKQITEILVAITTEQPDVRSLKLFDPKGNLIAAHQTIDQPPPAEASPGWHIGVGGLSSGGGQLSRLEIALFKGEEAALSFKQIVTIFLGLSALWAIATYLVVRAFCWVYIEKPSQQLQNSRESLFEPLHRETSFGIWEEAIQAEVDKREKLRKLLASIDWRAREVAQTIPSRAQAVQTALKSIDDLLAIHQSADK